jgi:hypothetical protein
VVDPVASFTATGAVDATTPITLDSSASTDPDGTIVSRFWELVSGPSPGTFSAPTGTTTVFTPTATVAPAPFLETFTGTDGAAPTGWTATTSGSATFAIQGNRLRITPLAGSTGYVSYARVGTVLPTSLVTGGAEYRVDFVVPASGTYEHFLQARMLCASTASDANNIQVELQPANGQYIVNRRDASNVVTQIGGKNNLALTGKTWRMVAQISGTSVKVRLFDITGADPGAWDVDTTVTGFMPNGSMLRLDGGTGAAASPAGLFQEFDNVHVAPLSPGGFQNRLNEASALLDTASVIGDTTWQSRSAGGANEASLSTTLVLEGTKSLWRQKDAAAASVWDPFQSTPGTVSKRVLVSAGEQITFRGEFQRPDGAGNMLLFLEWFDDAVASTGTAATGAEMPVATTGASVVHVTGTAPAGTTNVRLGVRCASIGANHRVVADRLSVHSGSDTGFPKTTVPFFESFTGTDGAAWDATKWTTFVHHASTAPPTPTLLTNEGRFVHQRNNDTLGGLSPVLGIGPDVEATAQVRHSGTSTEMRGNRNLWIRADSFQATTALTPANGVGLRWYADSATSATLSLIESAAGTVTTLATTTVNDANFNRNSTATVRMKVRAVGNQAWAKIWVGAEPAAWTFGPVTTARLTGSRVMVGSTNFAFTAGQLIYDVLWDNVQASVPPAFTPAAIPNLAVWLEGDSITGVGGAEAVSTWPDQSGLARHATQGTVAKRPTFAPQAINGKPALRFDGVDDWMTIPGLAGTTQTQTLVMVFRPITLTGATTLLGVPGSAAGGRWWYSNPTAPQVQRQGFWTTTAASNPMVDTRARIEAVTIATGGSVIYYADGGPAGTVSAGDAFSGTHPDSAIGTYGEVADRFTHGDIAAVIVYDRVLTATELRDLHSYLGTKYGIVLPAVTANLAPNPSFESAINATTNWRARNNTSNPATTTAQALHGTSSLALVAVAAASETSVDNNNARIPVTAGTTYTMVAHFRAATVARNCQVGVEWLGAGDTYLSFSSGASFNSTTAWNKRAHTAVAPAGAVQARFSLMVFDVAAAGETHYADAVSFHEGSVQEFRP